MKKLGYVLFSMLAIALVVSGTAMAQNNTNTGGDNSTFFVTYYANNVAAAPDETVRIINDGDQGAPSLPATCLPTSSCSTIAKSW